MVDTVRLCGRRIELWDNVTMSSSEAPLHHVIVVGGSDADWAATSAAEWRTRVEQWGKVADRLGASWLSIRPFSGDATLAGSTVPAECQLHPDGSFDASSVVGNCIVEVRPVTDGRAALADAIAAIDSIIDEASISARLNHPAEADPDLVVVLGESNLLPPSLVWELAYSELVFVDSAWSEFGADQLECAIESYHQRHRRFGGVD